MSLLKDRLREARAEAGLTQGELGTRAGVAQSTIAALETGDHKTSRDIADIAAALGVETLWLATGRGPKRREGTPVMVDHGVPRDVLELARKLTLVPKEKLKAISVLLGLKL